MAKAVENDMVPRIGAQFFINPDDTIEDTQRHFELMQQHGIRLVRLFILWEHVEPRPGLWDFSRYDAVYDLAETYGIQMVSTLTAEDPPQWLEDKPFYHHYANLNCPDLKEASGRYIQATVKRYHSHPAHYAWILMNEPELFVNQDSDTLEVFHQWLKEKYGTIDSLNSKWYRQYQQFEEIKIYPNEAKEYWQCFYAFVDWHNFLKDNLVQQLQWIRGQVREIDPLSPLHLNPKGFFGNLAPVGQDYWKENRVSDILGASIHPAWKFLWFERKDHGIAFSFCVDLIRSAADGKSFWVTELQSGATLLTGMQPYTPSPQELTAWLLDAIGGGAKSVIYWMWHPRTYGQEAGEWGIVTANHGVSKRLLASAQVSRMLEDHSKLFADAKPEASRVAVFYNHATELLSLIEGSELYRTPEAPIQSLAGVYKALSLARVSVDFVNEEQILSEKLSHYEVLYLPYSYAMNRTVQESVATYVRNGGILWAEAPCAWKNEYGEILREQPLMETFGISINEFCGCSIDGQSDLPYLCQADLEPTGAEICSQFVDGSPAVLSHLYGSGKAFFVNSTPSLGYFQTGNSCYAEQILLPLNELAQPEIMVETGDHVLRRMLLTENERILILENWNTEASDCKLVGTTPGSDVVDLLSGEHLLIETNYASFRLNAHETKVLLITSFR